MLASATLRIRIIDETPTGETLRESELALSAERITLREVITRRIHEEVERFNCRRSQTLFKGLVQPADADVESGGFRLRRRRKLNPRAQTDKALLAFLARGFFVLVNDRQVTDLDQPIVLGADTRVAFVKVVPLVAG